MSTNHEAHTDFPVHELIKKRWSPVSFDGRSVEKAKVQSMMAAAQWAPSCFNDQPWSWMVATRDDKEEFANMLSCLVPFNQQWAKHAGVLMISLAHHSFEHNGKPNRHAFHDVGLAVANLTLQAETMGLYVHQMGGFDPDAARKLYAIPAEWEPVAAIAVGYYGAQGALPPEQASRDSAERKRRPLNKSFFAGKFGTPTKLLV